MPRDGTEPRPNDDDDGHEASRRRSLVALIVVLALIGVSLYVGHVLKSSSQLEDCEMQGRTNCAPITADHP